MEYRILEEEIPYTGKELRSKWVENQTGCPGDAAVAFVTGMLQVGDPTF